jgi:hypothetical protein
MYKYLLEIYEALRGRDFYSRGCVLMDMKTWFMICLFFRGITTAQKEQ